MKILITGGSGFVGKHLISKFKNKYNILFPASSELDLTNSTQVKNYLNIHNFDVIINCAVRGGRRTRVDTEKDFYNNIKSLDNILEFCNDHCKIITFSSGAEIYKSDTFYGLSKKISTLLIKNKKNIKNLRIYNVFGESGMKDSFVYSTIEKCLKNEDIIIWENLLFDIYYINDLVNLVELIISNSSEEYEEIDCVYEQKYKLSNIAELIKKLTNSNSNILIEQDNNLAYVGNYKYIPNLNLTPIENGLANVINSIK
jgi:nucleoside-diphosphate-sugar epimerase